MNITRNRIKKEQEEFIGVIPIMDMKHFIMLLLADLASKSKIYHLDGSKTKTACLSTDYKRIIEDIMYQENEWGIKFAELINIYSYYEFQAEWEAKFGKKLRKVLDELNKEFYYDFERDVIEIEFAEEEIDNIKKMYDEKTLQVMDHFTNLIDSYSFSRKSKLDNKIYNRTESRYKYEREELKKRAEYASKLKIAKLLK